VLAKVCVWVNGRETQVYLKNTGYFIVILGKGEYKAAF
jgi:hypothetical protein